MTIWQLPRAFLRIATMVASTALLLASAPTLAAGRGTAAGTLPVDDSFVEGEYSWKGAPGKLIFRYKIFPDKGQLTVCGASVNTAQSLAALTKKLKKYSDVYLDDTVILTNISFFTRVRRERQLDGSVATCRASGYPAPKNTAGHTIDIRTSKTRFRD